MELLALWKLRSRRLASSDSKNRCPVPSHSSLGWMGLPIRFSHVPILKYTPKSQRPVPSYSPMGWTGLSMGFSHVPSSSISPKPSIPSHPTVPWDGRDCPWDSHVPSSSIPPNPSVPSRPIVVWDGRNCPWDSHVSLLQFLEPDLSIAMKALLF